MAAFKGTIKAYQLRGFDDSGKPILGEPRDLNFSASDVAGALVTFDDFGAVAQVSFPDATYVEDLTVASGFAAVTKVQWKKGSADTTKVHRLAQLVESLSTDAMSRFGRPYVIPPAQLFSLKQNA